jgi:hypothetical protein
MDDGRHVPVELVPAAERGEVQMSEYKVGEIISDTAHLDPRFHAELIVRSIEKKADSTIYHCEIIKGYKVGNFVSVRA